MSASVCKGISIRAPARGATSSHKRHVAGSRFQSALPRGERHNMVGYCQSHRDFNPRSREGSDDGTQLSVRYGCYFNPRSREGSDSINFANCFCDTISIRAPARGATFNSPVNDPVLQFQSALPRGERRSGAIRLNNFFIISIRAPARGATPVPAGQMQH